MHDSLTKTLIAVWLSGNALVSINVGPGQYSDGLPITTQGYTILVFNRATQANSA